MEKLATGLAVFGVLLGLLLNSGAPTVQTTSDVAVPAAVVAPLAAR